MKQTAFFLYVICFLILGVLPASAGSTTLTTYYPAPNGNYNKLTANNEGIGLATAAERLLIAGDTTGYAAFGDPGCGAGARFAGIGLNSQILAGCTNYNFASDPADSNLYINRQGGVGASIRLREGNADQMVIATGGAVGIGLANLVNPDANAANIKLEVSGAIAGGNQNLGVIAGSMAGFLGNLSNVGVIIGWNRSNFGRETDFMNYGGLGGGGNDGGFRFYTADTSDTVPHLTIDPKGNVGIGITTPGIANKLSVLGLGGGNIDLNVTGRIHSGDAGNAGGIWVDSAGNKEFFGEIDANRVGIFNNGAWSMTIDQNSNVGLNNTSPQAPLAVGTGLNMYAMWPTIGFNTQIVGGTWVYQTANYASLIYADEGASGGLVFDVAPVGGVGAGVPWLNGMTISSAGAVATPYTFTATSDVRLKQNIVPLTGALSKLDQLRGVSFEWNHLSKTLGHVEGQKGIGMIAQELQKVYPDLVMPIKFNKKEYLTVDYGKFTAVLLQSVKELKSQVNTMQDQINALQEKVKSLEKQK